MKRAVSAVLNGKLVFSDTIAAIDRNIARAQYAAEHPTRHVLSVKKLGAVSDARVCKKLGVHPITNPWAPWYFRVTFQERE